MQLDQRFKRTKQQAIRRLPPNVGSLAIIAIIILAALSTAIITELLHQNVQSAKVTSIFLFSALGLNLALIIFGWRHLANLRRDTQIRGAAAERAHKLNAHDPLTGFLNRRAIAEEGAAMLSHAKRRRLAVAMIILDLDHFKAIKEMHGHAVSEALLRQVAQEISRLLPHSALSARLGGDAFACAFTFDPRDIRVAQSTAERLVARMAQPFTVEKLGLNISCSVGIARSDDDCANIDALMRAADIAMYAAKRSGRNALAWFDASMEREIRIRSDLEFGLRSAVPRGEIIPYFEPQMDLATGRLEGFEALARWQHPDRGMVLPDAFIPIAEANGAIGDLSISIMRQAMLAARDWDPSLTLAVNISPRQLRDAWLAQRIISLINETDFPAMRLEIEITESSLFDNLPLARSIVTSLKEHGVRLALDDFGTGYSSLAHLRALPFDKIKIDRSFVQSINASPDSAAIVSAIIGLGDNLNLPITAEGVETTEVANRLREMGCSKAQGWLYGKPMPISGVRRMLAERRLLFNAPHETSEQANPLIQVG